MARVQVELHSSGLESRLRLLKADELQADISQELQNLTSEHPPLIGN